jgi:DNA-binding MarR family transcriptional regulator
VALRYFSKTNPSASTLTAFANQIGCTKGTASRTVHHLIRRGLLEKTANPNDARSSLLALTALGREMMEKDPIHELETQLTKLDFEEQHSLQTLLARLMTHAVGKS